MQTRFCSILVLTYSEKLQIFQKKRSKVRDFYSTKICYLEVQRLFTRFHKNRSFCLLQKFSHKFQLWQRKEWRSGFLFETLLTVFSAGAEVSVLTHEGETPLHCAADMPADDPFLPGFAGDQLEVMKLLLRGGVDVNARTNDGKTAFATGQSLFVVNYSIFLLLACESLINSRRCDRAVYLLSLTRSGKAFGGVSLPDSFHPSTIIGYRCDNRRFCLSARNCQVPTPTFQNLELEQQIRIFGAD